MEVGEMYSRNYRDDRVYHGAVGQVIISPYSTMQGVCWVKIIKNDMYPETIGRERPWSSSYMEKLVLTPTWEV